MAEISTNFIDAAAATFVVNDPYSPRNPRPVEPVDINAPPPPIVADLIRRLNLTHDLVRSTGAFVDTHPRTLAAAAAWATRDDSQYAAVGKWMVRKSADLPSHVPISLLAHADIPLVAALPHIRPNSLFNMKSRSYVNYNAASLSRTAWTVLVQHQRLDPATQGKTYAFFTTAAQFPNKVSAIAYAERAYAEQQKLSKAAPPNAAISCEGIFMAAPVVTAPLFASR